MLQKGPRSGTSGKKLHQKSKSLQKADNDSDVEIVSVVTQITPVKNDTNSSNAEPVSKQATSRTSKWQEISDMWPTTPHTTTPKADTSILDDSDMDIIPG